MNEPTNEDPPSDAAPAGPPAEPRIAQRGPYMVDLPAGDYWWCACGRSQNQPFCDGSHKGTPFTPIEFAIRPRGTNQTETVWMCGCKRSRKMPFCDGTHNLLPR